MLLRYLPSSLLNSISDLFHVYLWFIQRSFKQIITKSVSLIVPVSTKPSRPMQAFYAIKLRDTIKWTAFVPFNDKINNKQDTRRGSNSDLVWDISFLRSILDLN